MDKDLKIMLPSPLELFEPDWPGAGRVSIYIKRDDLIHPIITGNKWRKLKFTLQQAVTEKSKHIISFGGGYSNHLHALGYACHQLGIRLTALIRGQYQATLTATLTDLTDWGTEINYLTKAEYTKRNEPEFLAALHHQHPDALILPEGGATELALQGVGEIIDELPQPFDVILAPVGSGATLAGLIKSTQDQPCKVLGVAALKGSDYLEQLVSDLWPPAKTSSHWGIFHDYHCGGFAKPSPALVELCDEVSTHYRIPIEPVYSGKVMLALKSLLAQDYFEPNSRILILHTGGLQGNRSQ